jgi:phosphopentomutase
LAGLLPRLKSSDLLIITADHGCDPTAPGTDHTREYVPLLVYQAGAGGHALGIRPTFADIAATVLENFSLPPLPHGSSFLNEVAR